MSQENVEVVRPSFEAFERDGQIVRMDNYLDREKALEAAGLRE